MSRGQLALIEAGLDCGYTTAGLVADAIGSEDPSVSRRGMATYIVFGVEYLIAYEARERRNRADQLEAIKVALAGNDPEVEKLAGICCAEPGPMAVFAARGMIQQIVDTYNRAPPSIKPMLRKKGLAHGPAIAQPG